MNWEAFSSIKKSINIRASKRLSDNMNETHFLNVFAIQQEVLPLNV